ncbi:hypothetical protein BDP27DRAFT_70706 [Rhodocollybia butyracea]|uniref:Uncharacterized protein n=1 Tax=Rhodocollybia butyracea TaxID=206335 RepID=A0A9P5U3R2_9AGAR|nr:hypothetical protein BDP27DRAFT_70706 [Rhodocollybia butyracea]
MSMNVLSAKWLLLLPSFILKVTAEGVGDWISGNVSIPRCLGLGTRALELLVATVFDQD